MAKQSIDPWPPAEGEEGPAVKAAAVTPNDSTEIAPTKALYVGTGGSMAVQLAGDSSSVTLTNVPNGALLPIRAVIVLSTGTTASDIVALN